MALLSPPPPPTPAIGTAAPKKRIGKYFWKDTVMRLYLPRVLEVLANAGIHDPTKRRAYYTLIQMFPDVPKSKTKGYDTLLNHIADAQLRRGTYEDWDGYNYKLGMFRDDSRPDVILPAYRNPKQFVIEFLLGFRYVMDNYDMDYWDEQGCHVEILIEKQSMAASFRKVAKGVQVVVIPTKGDDGLEDQYKHYKRWKRIQQEEGKDVHILFFSDLDVYGENMEKTFKQKILQMIKLDIENYDEEPLNWDWKAPEDWNNFNECWDSLDSEKRNEILVKVLGQEFADNPSTEKYKDLDDAKWKELVTEVYIAGLKNKVPFYENHYDKKKPSFTFERIGLTLDQVNELNLTKLDLISLHDIYYPSDDETKAYVDKVGKDRMIKWAREHDNEFFATELDALLIANQYAFEEMVTNAVAKYHKKKVWKRVKDKLDSLWVEVELQKRVKFTELSDKEYELWKKDQLVLDEKQEEGPASAAIGMQANLTKEGKRRSFTKRQFNRTRKATSSYKKDPQGVLSNP